MRVSSLGRLKTRHGRAPSTRMNERSLYRSISASSLRSLESVRVPDWVRLEGESELVEVTWTAEARALCVARESGVLARAEAGITRMRAQSRAARFIKGIMGEVVEGVK